MKDGFLVGANWMLLKKQIIKYLPTLGVAKPEEFFRQVKKTYRVEMALLPEYGEYDVLKLNLSHAVMLGAIYQHCNPKPDIDMLTNFYRNVVLGNKLLSFAISRQNMFSRSYMNGQKKQAVKSQKATHPFTWKYTVTVHDANRFTADFTRCGIYDYLNSRGMAEIVPAMCALDYSFAEIGKHLFLRKTTIATGGKLCDCHYIRKSKASADEWGQFKKDQHNEAINGGRNPK